MLDLSSLSVFLEDLKTINLIRSTIMRKYERKDYLYCQKQEKSTAAPAHYHKSGVKSSFSAIEF
jgi:hypothetical protein